MCLRMSVDNFAFVDDKQAEQNKKQPHPASDIQFFFLQNKQTLKPLFQCSENKQPDCRKGIFKNGVRSKINLRSISTLSIGNPRNAIWRLRIFLKGVFYGRHWVARFPRKRPGWRLPSVTEDA